MTKRTTYALIGGVVVVAAAVGGFIVWNKNSDPYGFRPIVKKNPELASYVDAIKTKETKLSEDTTRVESYISLGMAWKSLADRTNNKEYYRKALEVYEQAIAQTERKNSLLMVNAANMNVYLADFAKAESYYKEAISLSPGDSTLYVRLAELYEDQMKKPKEAVVAVYDEGLKRVLDPAYLKQLKQSYLDRTK